MNWIFHRTECLEKMDTAVFELERRLPIWAPHTLHADLTKRHRGAKPQDIPQIGPPKRREFLEDNPQIGQFELFGSYPAIDVMRLVANEGIERNDPIDVLYVGEETSSASRSQISE